MAQASEEPAAAADRHERVPGYDVARAFAICGMVLINFGVYLLGSPRGAPGEIVLRWLAHVPGGRASSLFVTLAGVGIARMAWGDTMLARRTLLARAGVLVGLGAINVILLHWDIDILHFYAWYLSIAAIFFLRASPRALVLAAIAFGVSGALLEVAFPEEGRAWEPLYTFRVTPVLGTELKLLYVSVPGLLRDALVDGVHPIFPWLAFLLWGMWLGRLDLRERALRRTVLARALGVVVATELASRAIAAFLVQTDPHTAVVWLGLVHTDWSPSAFYVLSACGSATSIIALAHELVARWPASRIVRGLGNVGQLALSLYLVHAHLAIGIPRFFLGQSHAMPVETMLVYWCAFVLVVLPLAALYRTRFRRGPVEWLLRRVTGSPEHVAPLTPASMTPREPPRWAWPALALGLAALPLASFVGASPWTMRCPERVAVTSGETHGGLSLFCPRARYALTLEAPTTVTLATRSGLDVYLEVHREGRMIVEDDDSGPHLDARIVTTLAPGRYDVDVRPYSASTGPFVLEVQESEAPAAP